MAIMNYYASWRDYMPSKKVGRNDRKHNHNKYGVKVATDGNEVLPSGAIVSRVLVRTPKKSKKKARK